MITRKQFLASLFFFLVWSSCTREHRHHAVTRGMYYWKTVYKPTAYELDRLRQLQVHKMYIRVFDVDWDEPSGQAVPVAPMRMEHALTDSIEYVPVVFITQKTIARLTENGAGPLARKISNFIAALCGGYGIHASEIQIDCDWTATSREVYFALLNRLKHEDFFKGKTLSCTLRMHQVKYLKSSGIPPADKGLLMCYSMGDLKRTGNLNSILDAGEARDYLKKTAEYPLPLDVALPLFQWCVLFRDAQFRGILHEVTDDQVSHCRLFEHTGGNLYKCVEDTTWLGVPLKTNDVVRVERVTADALEEMARYTSERIPASQLNVLLFSCDSLTLSKYPNDELETVYSTYR